MFRLLMNSIYYIHAIYYFTKCSKSLTIRIAFSTIIKVRLIANAYKKLKKSLVELGIEVELKKEILDFSIFIKDPLQSNRIWIAERPLEEWIGATVGKSQCCDVCGDSECRTISINQDTFENIPENLIIKAGLLAAVELFK